MKMYRVTRDDNIGGFLVEGDIMPGSIPVNIPDSDSLKRQFISRFLQKADIEHGIDALNCISLDKSEIVNQALFVYAIGNLIKCFQNSAACVMMDEGKFKKSYPQIFSEYERFKNWRNKHYLHDENSMTEAVAFLLIAPEGSEQKFGGHPSVVWNNVWVNFLQEKKRLETVMQAVWNFSVSEIDSIADKIQEKYNLIGRQELLSYGRVNAILSSFDEPGKNRTLKN